MSNVSDGPKPHRVPVNQPFERLPQHAADPGFGPVTAEQLHDAIPAMRDASPEEWAARFMSAQPITIDALAGLIALAERRGVRKERIACTAIAREFGDLKHGHVPADGLEATREASRQIADAIQYRLD